MDLEVRLNDLGTGDVLRCGECKTLYESHETVYYYAPKGMMCRKCFDKVLDKKHEPYCRSRKYVIINVLEKRLPQPQIQPTQIL